MEKTQPDEHEVLAAIHEIIGENPDFGVKRVASSIKGQNPHWTLGDKRGALRGLCHFGLDRSWGPFRGGGRGGRSRVE